MVALKYIITNICSKDKVRYYRNQRNISLEEAVNKSITECLKENILTDFLNKNRREIVGLSIFEYDEEKELELLKKISLSMVWRKVSILH